MKLFNELELISGRPKPFEFYTSPTLWNDPHISKGMLTAHLEPSHDAASYRHEFIEKAVEWIAARFEIGRETRVCDFGCGPGLWTTKYAELGAGVTGIDLSERSVRYARETAEAKNLPIRYVLQDYLAYAAGERFDLLTMISHDFSVLSPDQRKILLDTFRESLTDDGAILLDVSSMYRHREATEKHGYEVTEGGYWAPGLHYVFSSTFKYEQERLLCDKYTVIESERRFEVYAWDQCYSVDTLTGLFESSGLSIVELYSDVAGAPLEDDSRGIAVVATKS